MRSEDLRNKFLEFFKEKNHRIVASSSLIPENDSSVLFTTAGMQQFKFYYTGQLNPLKDDHFSLLEPLGIFDAATCQKCFRTTDIDSVGDESHLTFFEMLGNFSFGGYFKEKAISFAWEFINKVLNIPLERIYVAVFGGDKEVPFDEESYNLWLKLGIPEEKIIRGSREDNFWGPTGQEGPCGPTTEIYVDEIEIWNLVFNEYFMHRNKSLEKLKIKGVDTGMGLERLALIMQYPQDKKKTVFETDLFGNLIDFLKTRAKNKDERIMRIIADHLRATVFLSAAGVIPSNTENGYVLRRLVRRIARFAKIAEIEGDWLKRGAVIVAKKYQNVYSELKNTDEIIKIINEEKGKFEKTLNRGLKEWKKMIVSFSFNEEKKVISGKDAFYLYESYGFPLELLKEMAEEKKIEVDEDGFQREQERHRNVSRAGQEKKFGGHDIKKIQGGSRGEIQEEKQKIQFIKLHTAIHLLLAALREILSNKVEQKGSDITFERLRFDFSFPRQLTEEELKKIEDWVNGKIKKDLMVDFYEVSYEEAVKKGALAFFKDRYPRKVTVYEIKNNKGEVFSREICAGPHIKKTSQLKVFKIIKEEAVAKGVRRIKAMVE